MSTVRSTGQEFSHEETEDHVLCDSLCDTVVSPAKLPVGLTHLANSETEKQKYRHGKVIFVAENDDGDEETEHLILVCRQNVETAL